MKKPNIMFFPNEGKASKKTRLIPMYARILLDGKKAEIRLPIEIEKQYFCKWNPRIKRFEDYNCKPNIELDKYAVAFEIFVKECEIKSISLSPSVIRDNH